MEFKNDAHGPHGDPFGDREEPAHWQDVPEDDPDAVICQEDCDRKGSVCDPEDCPHWQEHRCPGNAILCDQCVHGDDCDDRAPHSDCSGFEQDGRVDSCAACTEATRLAGQPFPCHIHNKGGA
jgi:hypothetical protein